MNDSTTHDGAARTVEAHPLEPFLPAGARLLMLGSFPPPRRRWSMEFFYPNLQNDMWRIAGLLAAGDKHHFLNPEGRFDRDRIEAFCRERGIALYDTSVEVIRLRENASDDFLQVVRPVDLAALLERLPACRTIVATGGCGNIYSSTSNPIVATGDGVAMCHRAKAITENMEFIQFHPTTLYNPGEKPNFLITEAMRGFGAILRLQSGEEFMDKYHPMKSLAPRDVVARAIYREMTRRGEDFVYLDVTHKDPEAVRSHFPNIYEKCRSIGIDITRDLIPVTPAAHYCCGGVKVDTDGQTSVKRLYALGETSCTGLHGANRLASNSLIEAVVYADRAAAHAAAELGKTDFQEGIPDWDFEGTQHTEEMLMIIQSKREMQTIMSNYVGIVRSNLSLKRAMRRLEIIYEETEELYNKTKPNRDLCELRNMIATAYLVIKQGRELKESVGCHYNMDYPAE